MLPKQQLLDLKVKVHITNNSEIKVDSSHKQSVCLLLEYRDNGGSKELFVQVTDENEPLLLLSSSVNEVVYSQLQSSQNLLVEFSSFPGHFSSLIKKCISEENSKDPKFILLLKLNETARNLTECCNNVQLEIMEMNVFKNLLHLSVPLLPASYQTKLAHLSRCINSLKAKFLSEEQSFNAKGNAMLAERNGLQNQVKNMSAEINNIKQELERRKFNYSERESMLLAQQKEKLLQAESTFDRKMARDKRQVEEKVNKKIDEYMNKFKSQNKKIVELTNANDKIDKIKNELKEKNAKFEKDRRAIEIEVDKIKKSKNEMSSNLEEQCRAVLSLESRAIGLEEELQKATTANQRMWEDMCPLRTENDEIKSYLRRTEDQLQSKIAECEDMYVQFQESVKFIEKYRTELKSERWKSKDLTESLTTSRQELKMKTKECDIFKESMKNSERDSNDRKNKLEDLEKELESSKKKLNEQEVTIKSNENVIGWLKNQLDEIQKTEAIIKQTPLAEAYLATNRRSTSPKVAASTPVSADARAIPKGILALSAVRRLPSDSNPSNEGSDVEKENNSPGLDPKYLQGIRNRSGLLRTNFDTKPKPPASRVVVPRKEITKEFKKLSVDNKKPKPKTRSSYFD